jgi:hypothetical protein
MLKSLLVVALLFTAQVASASAPTCPAFPYDLSEEEGVKELRTLSIDQESKLTALQAEQLIQTAKWYKSEYKGSDEQPMTAQEAIAYLADSSEGGDILITVFKFEAKVYTIVQAFPGGNPYGLVFKGRTALAERTDGDVTCR